MQNTIKNQPIVRNTEKDFDIIKREPIIISKRKSAIERYTVTLSDGTQRNFKRCSGGCGELLTYESFSKYKRYKDGRRNECGKCVSESSRKRQVKLMEQTDENEKRTCLTCGEEKKISEYTTDGKGYRKSCRKCQNKSEVLRAHAKKSRIPTPFVIGIF